MSEIILDMWLYTHHTSALLAKKSDNINKVSPILLPLQTLHIKSTNKIHADYLLSIQLSVHICIVVSFTVRGAGLAICRVQPSVGAPAR